jgi:hypothetical protein
MHKGKDRSGKNTNTSTWICKLCVLIDASLLIIYMCFNMDSLVHINCRLCYCHELQAMNVFSFYFLVFVNVNFMYFTGIKGKYSYLTGIIYSVFRGHS